MNKIFKIKELASALGSTEAYVRKLMKQGKIVAKKEKGIQVVDLSLESNKYLVQKIKEKRKKIISNIASNEDLEKKLWKAADSLRGNVDSSHYKHVCLGLIFLKYISDKFESIRDDLSEITLLEGDNRDQFLNDRSTYEAENAFYIPEDANWDFIKKNSGKRDIASIIDSVLLKIEKANNKLEGVLWRDYSRQSIDPDALGELINFFSEIDFNLGSTKELELLGRIYEYFIGQFADSEGRRGGEYFTPVSLIKVIAEIVQPKEGDVIFDPACGSGGLLVKLGEYAERKEKGRRDRISFYGQEFNDTTQKIAKMNAVIHGMNADIKQGNSYHDDKFKDLKADIVVANPPFNDNWNKDRISETDSRFKYGLPNEGNANFIWIQHFISHLNDNGRAGFVLANGSLSSGGKEGEIREKIIEDDLVEVVISCPTKLFYNVSIPCCIWFLSKNKGKNKRKTLFIDATEQYKEISRRHVEFTEEHIDKIVKKIDSWRGSKGYKDIAGFCKSVKTEEIKDNEYVLTPGRYIDIEGEEYDEEKSLKVIENLSSKLQGSIKKESSLNKEIEKQLKNIKI